MILVGELEYTDRRMAPHGHSGVLWVGMSKDGIFKYTISPAGANYFHGDSYLSAKSLSITEFLQGIVDSDVEFGRTNTGKLIMQFGEDNVGIRLKGMSEWIYRKPLKK